MNPLRKKENLHIVFWLLKDFAWLMDYKLLGITMAIPTFLLSIWLTIKSKENRSDFIHNLAVSCWITGNAIWMYGEFFYNDRTRQIAMPFFIVGIGFVVYYYTSEYIRNRKKPTD